MRAISFPGHNLVLGKDQPQYNPLPALHWQDKEGRMTFQFALDPKELDEVLATGTVWITQLTFGNQFQPIRCSSERPFQYNEEDQKHFDSQKRFLYRGGMAPTTI